MADAKISALTTAASPLAGTEVLPIVQSGSTVKVSVANLSATQNKFSVSTTPMNWSSGGHVDVPNDGGLFSKGVYNNIGSNWVYDGALKYQVTGAASWYQQNSGYHVWYSAASGSAGATISSFPELMALWPTGDLKLASGNLVPSTAAKGINFTANSAAAGKTSQLLNWYEEGTFTPTYYGASGSAGSLAYSEQTGKYTRIGRQVTVTGTIILTNKGSWTGRVQIGGLPFSSTADQYTGAIELRNCTFTGNYVIMEIGRASTSFARFVIVNGAGANSQLDDTMVANNSGFLFTLTYFV